jgi:hypothetical protein
MGYAKVGRGYPEIMHEEGRKRPLELDGDIVRGNTKGYMVPLREEPNRRSAERLKMKISKIDILKVKSPDFQAHLKLLLFW